jgi:hypothetical protein
LRPTSLPLRPARSTSSTAVSRYEELTYKA